MRTPESRVPKLRVAALMVLLVAATGFLSAWISLSACETSTRGRLASEHRWHKQMTWLPGELLVRTPLVSSQESREHRAPLWHRLFSSSFTYRSPAWERSLESELQERLLEGFTLAKPSICPWLVRVHYGYLDAAWAPLRPGGGNAGVVVDGVTTFVVFFGYVLEVEDQQFGIPFHS